MLTPRLARWLLLSGLLPALLACGQPPGAACQIEGSGFTARHDCATQCLSRWSVQCPDASRVMPAVCAGRETCTPGSCPDGQACYAFDDPFDERSYCVPADVCLATPDDAARLRWERASFDKAAEMRARYKRGSDGRATKPVAPEALQSGPTK